MPELLGMHDLELLLQHGLSSLALGLDLVAMSPGLSTCREWVM